MTWVLIGIVVSVFCLYKVMRKNKEEREKKNWIPRGSSGWPLLGETLDFIACGYSSRPVSFMEKRAALYGKVFRTHILGKAIIVSTDPEVNKVVLQNQGNAFIPHYPKSISELLGKYSILHINGPLQKRLHALIGGFLRSPQFKAQITRDIEESVRHVFSSWMEKQDRRIYLQEESRKIAFEVMVKTLMSVGRGEDLNLLRREFEEYCKGLISLPIKLPGTRLYKSLKAKERMLKVVRSIIQQRKMAALEEKQGTNGLLNDVIDVLLRDTFESSAAEEAQPRLPLDSIGENLIELMIPGEETVPTALTLAVKFLSDSPVELARLLEENMELKRQKAKSGDEYYWTDYVSLPFTQNVISETLRMGNIVNAVWREAVKDVKIKGHLIPRGWCVLTSFSSLHMDEANYENPYEFNPCRWEKTGASVNSNTFTPFGGGQRLCPGLELSRLEIAIFLHHLVTTYRWVAEDDDITYFPFVRLKRKLPITITPLVRG
ncbi:3-epi-6-deoxocathasterone 23-monooxygenase CYP90C1-like [Coffea arabica]|uniref:3-epi-6-deoxocathasterone 23-monooxygenase CYP90C1-like n=1 Tax=Coffea arabica TaxID=13443 RepID=A0A6P6TML5_COFAR